MDQELHELSIAALQQSLDRSEVSSVEIVRHVLARIEELDRQGPALQSILQTNPDAESLARDLDAARGQGKVRGPLHGIPILLKDNIDTADAMETTAGSLALLDSKPERDAHVVERLRSAGAILLGKTNMSEWANFRSTKSTSGWSCRGGQARNPYVLDRSPCGSSSGSATAVAAGLAPVSLGTETSGSILCPASFNSVVGIKPTCGLTSRAGVIPIAHSQDTVGPFGRSVADAVAVLSAIAGPDPRDRKTSQSPIDEDYRRYLHPGALKGVRVGVPRAGLSGYSAGGDAILEDVLTELRSAGADIIDPADLPSAAEIEESKAMLEVLLYEFKADLNAYLATRHGSPIRSLRDIIHFNRSHASSELRYFDQDLLEMAEEKGPLSQIAYRKALASTRRMGGAGGIDAVIEELRLDALIALTAGPPFLIDLVNGDASSGGSAQPAAMAGYPAISLPAGYVHGLPVGVTLMAGAYSEPLLISLAFALEQRLEPSVRPRFLPSAPVDMHPPALAGSG